jgi:hypothetical protein
MNELKELIAELQKYADDGVTEVHPYINREDDNWDAKLWVLKPPSGFGFDNVIEIGMEEV